MAKNKKSERPKSLPQKGISFAKSKYQSVRQKITSLSLKQKIKRRPFFSFFLSLFLLFLAISLGSFITKTPPLEEKEAQAKQVTVFSAGGGSEVTTQARVQKTGVIKIYAQSPGIVQAVNFKEGDTIQRGQSLVSLSTNYQGANAQGVQAQIAATQHQNTVETFETQKDLINKQREVAVLSNANTEELRQISAVSVGETRDLINLNRQVIDSINSSLTQLEAANVNGSNDSLILQAKQAKSQVQAGLVQLDANIRNLEYQSSDANNPTQLANLQKDIALKQLDVQEKALDMGKKVSGLSLTLAQIQASLMYPASPVTGTVERIHVVFGQNVAPGTLIATVFQPENQIIATAFVPQSLAPLVSQSAMSQITLSNGQTIEIAPRFVSSQATDGQLFSVLYEIPSNYENKIADQEFLSVSIPISEIGQVSDQRILVPLDAVYQSPSGASVFVIKEGKAEEKPIITGQIIGASIEVLDGVSKEDHIILDRTVVSGDRVVVSDL